MAPPDTIRLRADTTLTTAPPPARDGGRAFEYKSRDYAGNLLLLVCLTIPVVQGVSKFLNLAARRPRWDTWLRRLPLVGAGLWLLVLAAQPPTSLLDELWTLLVLGVLVLVLTRVPGHRPVRTLLLALVPFAVYSVVELLLAVAAPAFLKEYDDGFSTAQGFAILWLLAFIFIARGQKKQLVREEAERMEEEAERQRITTQNTELERLVAERTATLTQQTEELRYALAELKTTQTQLIQSEKMASLGELTAGIAHEIQNPLNFVTNFADVSAELVQELEEEQQRPARDLALEAELLADLRQNLQKITHHGQRASGIVRNMLEHSRQSTGERQPTNLNQLADEYLRLAYHGLRAKDKTFNATITTFFDPSLKEVEVVAQDLGRVLLNLFTNAFYAVRKRQQAGEAGYAPTVSVSTLHRAGGQIEVRVQDNGTGIPADIQPKIFQPFFTTKPTGEGTGLGLSLSYDIVTKGHGGTLTVASKVGEGTEFIVSLPLQ